MSLPLAGCAADQSEPGTPITASTQAGTLRAPSPAETPRPSASRTASESPSTPADPARHRLIQEVRWVTRGGLRSLAVRPTQTQREHPTREWGQAAWEQVIARVPAADTPGMREQYICHAMFAAGKSRFYLEPWRPARSLTATILEGCNPGPRKDLG